MKILALLADRVEPAVNGPRVRNRHLWPSVAQQGHEVRIIGLDLVRRPQAPPAGPPGLQSTFVRPARPGFFHRAVGASTCSHHEWPPAPKFAEEVDRAIAQWQPDVVHAEELRMAAFLPRVRGRECRAKQTLTLHNVESDLIRQTGSTKVPFAGSLFATRQIASLVRFEERAVHAADGVFAYSPVDLARYRALYPRASWRVTRSGTNAGEIVPVDAPSERRVLLPGSLSYAPNVSGLEWFIETVLPRLPEDVEITVVGSNASEALKHRIGPTRMNFIDTPPSLTPLFASHGLCVIPLSEGGGTRGRIPEALAHGRVVVTTTKGAEGLELNDSAGVITADEPAGFATAIVKWSEATLERQTRAMRGREVVLERFDWSVVAREFVKALSEVLGKS